MKLRFKYTINRTFATVWSHIEIEGEGIWTVDIDKLADDYYNSIQANIGIEDYIKNYIEFCLELEYDSITFNEEDLATLIVHIQNYEIN